MISRALVAAALLWPGAAAIAQDYDVVILNGRVMDPETSFDAVAHVGVRDGRIAVITDETISGAETIDASGHVVTAGFIDQHFHWVRPVGYKLALRDGVTTAMDLEAGADGRFINEWYAMHDGRSPVNYGTASSHEFARAAVLDGHPRRVRCAGRPDQRAIRPELGRRRAGISTPEMRCWRSSTRACARARSALRPPSGISPARRRAKCTRFNAWARAMAA
jgi:hypothetical protein